MKDSVFTKIIKGEIPCHKVYEDDGTMAIMDIYPAQPGMVVVFPKQQIANVEDLPDDVAAHVAATVHRVMKALRALYPDVHKIAVQVAGFQTPDHAHYTVFPANSAQEFHADSPTTDPDHATLAAQAERLKKHI